MVARVIRNTFVANRKEHCYQKDILAVEWRARSDARAREDTPAWDDAVDKADKDNNAMSEMRDILEKRGVDEGAMVARALHIYIYIYGNARWVLPAMFVMCKQLLRA